MTKTHTHTFVGGPADGEKRAVQYPEQITIAVRTEPQFSAAAGEPFIGTTAPVDEHLYDLANFDTEDGGQFLFWKYRELSYADAVSRLFERYCAPR